MILIDANIFMYAAGAERPHKAPSVDFLRRVALGEIDAAVDAEVLQDRGLDTIIGLQRIEPPAR